MGAADARHATGGGDGLHLSMQRCRGAADAEQHPAERQYLCQSIRHAAGLSRREVAHSEALARGAAQLERDFDDALGKGARTAIEVVSDLLDAYPEQVELWQTWTITNGFHR